MVMNSLTEGKRFSPCWRRSSDVPLVVEHFPSLTATLAAMVAWCQVSKRSVRFGSVLSEMPVAHRLECSGAKDSKAVLYCEWPLGERPAFACLFAARKR